MPATTCILDGVPHPILQEADFVLHDPGACHSTTGLFDPDADGCDPPIGRFFRRREFPSPRCFQLI